MRLRGNLDRSFAGAAHGPTGRIDLAAAGASAPGAASLIARHGIRAAAPLYAARHRIRAQRAVSDAEITAATRRRFAARAGRAPVNAVAPDLSGSYVIDLGKQSRTEIEQAIASLQADPDVVYVEEDKRVRAVFVPNDPRYLELYALQKLGAAQAWNTVRGDGIVVAVTDTGVDYTHPDIRDNMWTNAGEIADNGEDDDGNGFTDDTRGYDFVGADVGQPTPDSDPLDGNGHGTHVAGTIAAQGDNATGIVGVAFRARIMAVRGLDDAGFGTDSGLANAIVYAVDQGADVINASWGGQGASQAVMDAVNYAHAQGVLFVAAAGNDNLDASRFYPANVPRAVAVAAVDQNDTKAGFSNHGSRIDVTAPGVGILSLQAGSEDYLLLDGTSMAAPHVSGLAALLMQARPTFTLEQLRQVLRVSATDLGAAGKDLLYGYGRVNAAAAVNVTQALEARFFSPADGVAANASVALVGTARGPGFARYIVEWGAGSAPTTWTQIRSSTTPTVATGGTLGTFNTTTIPDGIYTVRLRVIDTANRTFSDQVQLRVQYLTLATPAPEVPALYTVFKPGSPATIVGRATGPSFRSFRLEWAPGRDATSGFSTAGITLAGGGTRAVIDGPLGTWTPPATASGEYTVRLSVTNATFTSRLTATVYLEPDLVAATLPAFVPYTSASEGPLPVRMADGTTRLVLCGFSPYGYNVACHSMTSEGVIGSALGIGMGSSRPPSAGELDPLPGEEVVIADLRTLRIVRADLTPVREITTTQQESFSLDRVSLSDLDGDGFAEIIALAHDSDESGLSFGNSGTLYVYRGTGELVFSKRLASSQMPNGYIRADAVAIDLNGDGRKEILAMLIESSWTRYELQAFSADGTAYAAWPTPSFPIQVVSGLRVADLDHDGRAEILVSELVSDRWQLRVLGTDGATRPGWPQPGITDVFAVGDLNRDQRDEIVSMLGSDRPMTVLRHDGTPYPGVTWPAVGLPGAPVIADLDNDSFPEIVFSETSFANDPIQQSLIRVKAVSRTGAVVKEWRQFGMFGQMGASAAPSVGDFNRDGLTDVAVHVSLISSGTPSGEAVNGVLSVLTTRAAFNPLNADWPLTGHDPQNSREKLTPSAGLPGAASNPRPMDLATGILVGSSVSWTAGAGATSHDVYFGTANPPTFRGNQTGTTFDPGPMAASTTYYWRIDERSAAGTRTGTVWRFTTGAACAPESDPAFCTRMHANCGTVSGVDNCGTQRTVQNCGTCTAPQTCGGGGVPNVCGGGSAGTNPCAGLCTSPVVFTGPSYQSGSLGTGATCHETTATLTGANCGNFASARTFVVNGATVSCTGGNITLPAKRNAGYCFQASPGDYAWAYFSTW